MSVVSPIRDVGAHASADLLDLVDDRTRTLLGRSRRARRGSMMRRRLVVADLLGLAFAFIVATALHGSFGGDDAVGLRGEYAMFLLSLPLWYVVAHAQGLYDRDEERASHSTADDVAGVFHVVTAGAWTLVVGAELTGLADPDVAKVITFWLLAVTVVPLGRSVARETCRRSASFLQNTVIVGAGDVGQLIARKLLKHPEYGINLVGFVDRWPKMRRPDLPDHLTILGPPDRLAEIVERLDVERVIISFSNDPTPETLAMVRTLREHHVQVDLVPRLFELVGPRVGVHSVEGMALVNLPPARLSRTALRAKRAVDLVGASLGLLAAAPLLAYIAVRVRRDSAGPVFFRQTRLGGDMRPFTALKFRTMKVDTDVSKHKEYISRTMSTSAVANANGMYKLDRSDVITPFGSWLRKTSLDELPQLLNVLRGDMSLVGPRPCIEYETEHFQPHHFERFGVPQGLTGLWQVTARANSTFGEALDMDVAYARGWSFWLDLRLLLRTPFEVLRQRKATA
ncbi:MAG TPA: sugar transferase [Baekduia sp.]|nr:sugar transferase [Baekduia sp.]